MADDSKKNQAEAQFRKTQRAEDGRKAMSEYEADAAAVRVKTAKLRALRLAHEAQVAAATPVKAAPAKKGAKKAKAAASVPLSVWLKDREGSGHNS